MNSKEALVVFEGTKIRRKWYDDQWFLYVVDVVQVLTDSPTPRQYLGIIKDREFQQLELSPIWVQLKLLSADGKSYKTYCSNIESMFWIIKSIMSLNRLTQEVKRYRVIDILSISENCRLNCHF